MSKFTVAGVSIHKGEVKVRFCSDLVLRVKNLQKQGDSDIKLIELPHPMGKVEACDFLIKTGDFSQYESSILDIRNKKVVKSTKTEKITVSKPVVDPEIESIKELAAA